MSWQPILTTDSAVRAVNIALATAVHLRERDQVEAAILAAKHQTVYPRSIQWQPYGVGQGYAGLAIMCGYLDACFPNDNWDRIGHNYIEIATCAVQQEPYLPMGLFSGLSGLAFAVWSLSRGGRRYPKLLASLEDIILPQVEMLASALSIQTQDMSVDQFDLISGLSGIGAYLLCRRESSSAVTVLTRILQSLITLAGDEAGLPRWYTPVYLLGDETIKQLYPHGHLNFGLAHGIPGPLALLSLASLTGMTVDGIEHAIRKATTWLLQYRLDDQWGINWPTAVQVSADGSLPIHLSPEIALSFEPSRTAWCYGSPGVARSLWLAGQALDEPVYRELAISAMEAVYQRPLNVRSIDSPTFCHGVAGLTQITLRFAHDTRLPQFVAAGRTLCEQLLSLYSLATPLGYYDLQPEGNRIDQPGLLDGASGVPLVLLAAATYKDPTWDRLFLLS